MRIRNILKSEKGFSLVEIAIGVLVVGILIGVVTGGIGMVTKAKVQHESDIVNTLVTAAHNYENASQTTYTGVSISVLQTGNYLSSTFNSTNGNSWGGAYTVAPNATVNTSVDITIGSVPDAPTAAFLTNNFQSLATCVYDTKAQTWTATFQ